MKEQLAVMIEHGVLNLVINGMPSILEIPTTLKMTIESLRFKPCYKWNAFNTIHRNLSHRPLIGFKPCYNWNAFNTEDRFLENLETELNKF